MRPRTTPEAENPKTPRRWMRRAGVVVLSTALLGGAAPLTAAGGASAAVQAKASAVAAGNVTLHELECVTAEDWDADEAYITVNGQTVWTAQDSVDDGGKRQVNIKASTGDVVRLYDEDFPDPDDFLGEDTIEGTQGTLVFDGDDNDAYYTLSYGPS